MNALQTTASIRPENLDKGMYVESLLYEAAKAGVINEKQMEHIQLQCLELLTALCKRYTKGKSASVRVETAYELMKSLLYTVGMHLKSVDVQTALNQLIRPPLQVLYEMGLQRIARQVNAARLTLHAVKRNRLENHNKAYNDTVDNGIDDFFGQYSMNFAAHDTPGMIDYPLYQDDMDVTGIEYIAQYIQKLFAENQFCQFFTSPIISSLMRGYHKQYEDLLINIFERVLYNAAALTMIDKDAHNLVMRESDRQLLQRIWKRSPEVWNTLVHEAMLTLCRNIGATPFLRGYIMSSESTLLAEWECALKNGQLERVFTPMG